jgi:hypothetical protein
MHTSRPIEVQGRFLGIAVSHAAAWRFIARHPVVAAIDGATFHDPAAARRATERLLARHPALMEPAAAPCSATPPRQDRAA